jgi:hypothetical protein
MKDAAVSVIFLSNGLFEDIHSFYGNDEKANKEAEKFFIKKIKDILIGLHVELLEIEDETFQNSLLDDGRWEYNGYEVLLTHGDLFSCG